MNDDPLNDAEWEKELRSLKPASVRPEAMKRWHAGLSEAAEEAVERGRDECLVSFPSGYPRKHAAWLLAASVVLSGCVVFFLLEKQDSSLTAPLSHAGAQPPIPIEPALFTDLSFEPNAVENHFVGATDEGVVGAVAGVPFRRVRFQLADAYHWENTENGSRLEMVIPREEVLLLPVLTY